MGIFFCFTFSAMVSGTNNASEYTPIGQLQQIGETENSVTIEYWAYASEQQAMSVELDVITAEKVSFEAVDKKRREITSYREIITSRYLCAGAGFRAAGFSSRILACDRRRKKQFDCIPMRSRLIKSRS